MGIFGKAIDGRTHKVLRNNLGYDVDVDFVASGTLSILHLDNFSKLFAAAVNDQGVYFIHKADVFLVLPWSKILSCKESQWARGVEITVEIERLSRTVTATPTQYPHCFWYGAEIRFTSDADQAKFIEKFRLSKLRSGFTEDSLEKYGKWIKYGVGMPRSIDVYHAANANWTTEEIRENSYRDWGKFLDAQAFLFFVGRSVCEGKLPGKVLNLALEEWKKADEVNSSFTLTSEAPSVESLDLINATSNLPWQGSEEKLSKNIPEEWVVARIETSPTEWQSEMKLKDRLIAIHCIGKEEGIPSLKIWNDFHKGESHPIWELEKLKQTKIMMFSALEITFSNQALVVATSVWE